jgi:hypothetical protein
MAFSSLLCTLRTKMTKLPLPLWSFRHSAPFRGIQPLQTMLVFSEFFVQLRQLQPTHPIKGMHERVRPLVISQDTIPYPAACTDDLHRYSDQPIKKPAELHPQKLIPILPSAHQQRKPCFQGPRQRGHHHIGPVGNQAVHRHPQRIDPILELFNEVFLIAPFIAQTHHLSCTQVGPVGDVEKVSNIVPQLYCLQTKPLLRQRLQ